MKEMKRILSLVLCFVMLVGMMPAIALNADATDDAHHLMFATDRHANTSVIGEIINNMESAIGENQLEYLGLGGDMVGSGNDHPTYNSSTVLAEVTGATSSLNADNVDIVAGIHDMNVNDDAGIVLPYKKGGAQIYEGDDYYVYGVEEYCISEDSNEQNWTAQADAFEAWANSAKVDPSKVIIVLSHYPLHAKRDDNDGAMYWHWALNAVATGNAYGEDTTVERDIVFFHGHNHTKDSNEYVYKVGDTMEIQNTNGTESAAIYYTYATAGYLNQNSKATLVTITDDQIVLTKYGTSGNGTAMATVDRVVTEETPVPTTTPVETDPVVEGIEAVSNKEVYYVGENLDITVYAVYSDGSKVEVEDYEVTGFDNKTVGSQTVTVTYGTCSTTVSVNVVEESAEPTLADLQVTYSKETLLGDALTLKVTAVYSDGTTKELAEGEYTVSVYDPTVAGTQGVVVTYGDKSYGFNVVTTDKVTVVADGMASLTVANVTDTLTEALADKLETGFVAYDIVPDAYNVEKNIAVVSMPAPEGADAVYYWNKDTSELEPLTDVIFENGKVVFTTNHFSTYVVGVKLPDGSEIETEGESAVVEGTGVAETTAYVLVSSLTAGKEYLIVNRNTAGSGYAMDSDTSGAAVTVNAATDTIANPYISDVGDALVWTASSGWGFASGNYNLGVTVGGSMMNRTFTLSTSTDSDWSYSSNRLSYTYRSVYTRYLACSSTGTWSVQESSSNVYFYEKQTISTGTVGHTYTAEGINVTDAVALEGQTVTLTSKLWDTPDGGTATEITSLTPTYEIVTTKGNPAVISSLTTDGVATLSGTAGTAVVKVTYTSDGLTAWDEFTVTAVAPAFDFSVTPETATVKIGATETLTPNCTMNGTTTNLGSAVAWTSDNDDVATVANGVVTGKAAGTATITAEWTDPAGVKRTDTVKVEVVDAVYTLDLVEGSDKTTPITETVVIKGTGTEAKTYSIWALIYADDANIGDLTAEQLANLTFIPSDTRVTIDSSTGVVTFPKDYEGTVTVSAYYEYAEGKSVTDTVTFSVSKYAYTVPSDGTNDFPEYPNEGAVRFDKTATALGNFSETGIAKVELSMTGVPYTTGSELDVTVMLDMSTSMDDTRIAATVAATKAFIDSIVKNEDGTYNANRIYVGYFNGDTVYTITDTANIGGELASVDSDAEYEALIDDIESEYDGSKTSSGTNYDVSLEKCYNVLNDIKTTESATEAGYNRQQFCVFMSDGGPTDYATSASTVISESSIVNYFSVGTAGSTTVDPDEYTNTVPAEYWSGLMKANDVTIYSVGLILQEQPSSGPQTYRKYTDDQYYYITKTLLTGISSGEDYFFNCESSSDTAEMEGIFSNIAQKILEAATDVVVEDKIGNDYTVNFSFPTGVTTAEADGLSQFYIQVVEYQLNADKERTGDPTVLENFTFDANGALVSHTVNGTVTCEGTACTHVTFTTNKVSAINGTYFEYTCAPLLDDEGNEVKNKAGDTITEEYLTWKADKLTTTELALQYFAHLDNSTGTDVDNQVPAGTYYTNEYATLTYTNVNGNRVQQKFPMPTMTWMGAKVTYVFYLVNEAGQPVNRAGRVVPFAEAIYVTNPVTYDVTWNELAGSENILAHDIFAIAGVPDVYQLYDESAQYVIRVYQTETVDTNGKNGNYFQISGSNDKLIDSELDSDSTVNNSTTVVFNTKAGKKYDAYGYYSIYAAGTTLTDGTNDIKTTVQATDIDYANTTVAFAVVWKPELVPDTVVMDYGLDVVIDVATNDNLASGVTGVSTTAPNVTMNSGTYKTATMGTTTNVMVDDLIIGTATVENLTSVRFSLNKLSGMQFSEPVKFYYESQCNYYTYDADDNRTLNTDFMYSSVTVIPATSIYYEDEYVTLKTCELDSEDTDGDSDTAEYIETAGWDTSSLKASATQDQDRPGESKISADLDADNNYGYDAAYSAMSTYSMNRAAMVNVTTGKYATAEFTFYGTGFDVISLTDTTTGIINVNVYQGTDTTVTPYLTESVDTYYGYKLVDGEWVTTTPDDPNALYQVPVLKIGDGKTTKVLPYGQYTVVITATYVPFLDHNKTDTGYNFYLDAIRVYNPTGNQSDVANDAYVKDGEAWPSYFEVRDQIIAKSTFDSLNDETVSGIVFIDGAIATPSIQDYTSFGPNNETYLAKNQAVAFDLNGTYTVPAGMKLAKIQLAVKSVGGTGKVEVYGVKNDGTKVPCLNETISTATDMYYDISALEGMTVVIKSTGDAVISITNVKVTYEPDAEAALATASEEETEAPMLFSVRRSTANAALATLNVEEEVPETTVPEETEPETTVPENTEPETTVPEETEPETTVPEETEPETTVPEETEPETTVPEETEPEETKPGHQEQAEQVIRKVVKIIKGFLDWIFG